MNIRNELRAAVGAGFLLLCCLLTGCSASFCGFQTGAQEELIFTCTEEAAKPQEISAEGSEDTVSPDGEPGEQEQSVPEEKGDGKVNLNTADLEELMTLNGVGESRAKAIVEYRTRNGAFAKTEDIMQIPGIKEGIFSKIKDQITVD